MEPIAIAAATLVAKWAAEAIVGEAAKSAWAGLTKIYNAVKNKFAGDQESTEVLDRLEQKPDSQGRVTELAEVLDKRMKADPNFAKELASLVKEAGQDPGSGSFVTQVMDNARVGKIVNIGSAGNVSF
jgi:hypothetical protein